VEIISKAERAEVRRSLHHLVRPWACHTVSDVLIFSVALDSDSETAESKKARKHENAARDEQCLPNGAFAAEEYADETDDETGDPNVNVSPRTPIW
jgi:hypothetical protein